MRGLRRLPLLLIFLACASASFAAAPAIQAAPPGEAATGPAAAGASPQGLPAVCVDAQSADELIEDFASRLKATIAASGALGLAPTNAACALQLHIPGNLLRFETAGGVMVSTVVIVTSASGRYLSSSIAACRADNLQPCAVRAVAAAKLALLMGGNGGV